MKPHSSRLGAVVSALILSAIGIVAQTASARAQETYVPGTSYFGANGYVEYIPGNLPLIFTAAHGGALVPTTIPVRTTAACGDADFSTVRDLNTAELTMAIQAAVFGRTGKYPHIIINHLHRNRLDANRPIDGGACGNADAEQAWTEFQGFVATAKASVAQQHGKGWYTDIHGHGHAIQRLELGYNMTATTLRRDDAELDGDPSVESSTSIKVFSQESPRSFSALLRGQTALGTLLASGGYPSVPSQQDPAPADGDSFFSGGYNTRAHGCMDGGPICGLQIECNLTGVRDTASNRASFAMKLVEAYDEYLSTNFSIYLPGPPPPHAAGHTVVVDNNNALNDLAWARFNASTNWSNATNSQQWENNFRLSSGSSSATNDGAELFFLITTPGTYSVDSWWPALSTRSQSASYRVFEVDGGVLFADLAMNQRINGAQWNSLGTFNFTRVGWAKVLMSRSLSGAGSLAADAARATLVAAPNRAPYARLAAPIAALEGSPVAFDGSRSFDLDHDALTYDWSFGDGGTSASGQLTHAFAGNATFDVTLTVADSHGATGAMTRSIVVSNVAPSVRAFAGGTILLGETYSSAGTFEDPGTDTWTATVDYGDGSGAAPLDLSGQAFALSHPFAATGVFTVAVDVFDGDDHGVASAEVVVEAPVQGLGRLSAVVSDLATSGALSSGNARSLAAKLDAATQQLGSGRTVPAENQLGAFINEVNALVRGGRLSEADGEALSEFARRIIASLAF